MTFQQKNSIVTLLMLVGVLLGGVIGYVAPAFMISIGIIGQLFFNALKIILIPIVVSSIIIGVMGLGAFRKLGRVSVSILLYFIGTSVIAVGLGVVLASTVLSGSSAGHAESFVPEMAARARATGLSDIYLALIPTNLVRAISEGQFLGLAVLAMVFGGVLTTMGRQAKVVEDFFKTIYDASVRIVSFILYAAPIGLFVLVGSAVAGNPHSLPAVAENFGYLALTLLIGILIQGLVILPLILKYIGNRSPIAYAGNMSRALLTALGTASSAATLPVTYSGVVDKNKVDSRAGSLVLPLGAAMNLNGTAMYLVIAAIFVAHTYGVGLSIIDMVVIGGLALVLSLGAAGVPGTTLFMLAMLFSIGRFPAEVFAGVGLLVAVDWLFDRGRAVLNVWGDAVGAAVVGESFEFKTARASRVTSQRDKVTTISRTTRVSPRAASSPAARSDSPAKRRESRTGDSRSDRERGQRQTVDRRPARQPQRNGQNTSHPRKELAASYKSETKPSTKKETKPSSGKQPEPARRRSIPAPPFPTSSQSERSRQSTSVPSNNRPVEADSPSTSPEVSSRESIQRERSKIASQFAVMKQEEEQRKFDTEESPELLQDSGDEVGSETIKNDSFDGDGSHNLSNDLDDTSSKTDRDDDIQTTLDMSSTFDDSDIDHDDHDTHREGDELPDQKVTKTEVETTDAEEPAVVTEPEQHVTEYGRLRNRKGIAKPKGEESISEDEEGKIPPPVDNYSTENISFGRQRRKRTRK